VFSLLLALKWNNHNMFWVKNHFVPLCNFPDILRGVSTDFDILCIQQAMLNTDRDNVLLAQHFFYELLWPRW
jgi:hypothetical protein